MITLRLAVPAVLVAAAAAGCFTYFVTPSTVPDMTGPRLGIPTNIDERPSAKDQAAAFQRAAEAILRRAPNAQASAATHETTIAGHIPLPKRRPILRP
jgi:hypothetical protein